MSKTYVLSLYETLLWLLGGFALGIFLGCWLIVSALTP